MAGSTATPPRGTLGGASLVPLDDDDDTETMPLGAPQLERVLLECGRECWPVPHPNRIAIYLALLLAGVYLASRGLNPTQTLAGYAWSIPAFLPALALVGVLELLHGSSWLSARLEVTSRRTTMSHGLFSLRPLVMIQHWDVQGVKIQGDDVLLLTADTAWRLPGFGSRAVEAFREVLLPGVPVRSERPPRKSLAAIIAVIAVATIVFGRDAIAKRQAGAGRGAMTAARGAQLVRDVEPAIHRATARYREGARARNRARFVARTGRLPTSREEQALVPADRSVCDEKPGRAYCQCCILEWSGSVSFVSFREAEEEPYPHVRYQLLVRDDPTLDVSPKNRSDVDWALVDMIEAELAPLGVRIMWGGIR